MKNVCPVIICLIITFNLVICESAISKEQTFNFLDSKDRNTTTFTLDAPFETINGLTNKVNGEVTVIDKKFSGWFKVPVKSIKTGNSTRDEHLKNERWLKSEKYPYIKFEFIDQKIPGELNDQKPVKVKVVGKFYLAGVKKNETIEVEITFFKQSEKTAVRFEGKDIIKVHAEFKIKLEDYKIERTSALILKVGEAANVTVDYFAYLQK